MTQTATVTALPAVPGGEVELTVARETACGHACDGCGGCGGKPADLVIWARSDISLTLGDRVEVYSGGVLGAAAAVYGLPVALFLLGYLATSFLPELWRYACGGAGFLLGIACAVLFDRAAAKRSGVAYRVLRKL